MTKSSEKKRMGRPPIPEDAKRVSFSASISPQANVLIEMWSDSLRDMRKCRRLGYTMDQLVRHAVRTQFNPTQVEQ